MANIQSQMLEFHNTIKLDDEDDTLREKRDRVLSHLDQGLEKQFPEDEDRPRYTHFNQGSYAMRTGVKPLNDDHDIDVGLRFEITTSDYPDPVQVKEWICDALQGHTSIPVEIRRPCVTVWYQREDEPVYHVDLAVYSDGSCNSDGTTYLAMGRRYSDPEFRFWERADPQGLMDAIRDRFVLTEDAAQFRRTIRYLKRWKDVKFPSDGNAAPVGIGLTVAAYHWFVPAKTIVDEFSNKYRYDDLQALRSFTAAMLDHFESTWSEGEWVRRLRADLPVLPYSDVFSRMTDTQMTSLEGRLQTLQEALVDAQEKADPVAACEIMQGSFGADFPVPAKEQTARRYGAPAIVSSSSSA